MVKDQRKAGVRIGCFAVSYVGFKKEEWQRLALESDKCGAIKALRATRNKDYPDVDDSRRMGLKEALHIVDAYMQKNGIV